MPFSRLFRFRTPAAWGISIALHALLLSLAWISFLLHPRLIRMIGNPSANDSLSMAMHWGHPRERSTRPHSPPKSPRISEAAPSRLSADPLPTGSAPNPASNPGSGAHEAGAAGAIESADPYFIRMRQKIISYLHYPIQLQRRRIQGEVLLKIFLEPSGQAAAIQIHQSSGSPELDQLALESARQAVPFAPYPAEIGPRQVLIPIEFLARD